MSVDINAYAIFVVDDDPAVTKALSRLLRVNGWRVETFASAEAFLAAREPDAAGCLVLDVNLPGLDGLALQQRLRETRRRPAHRVSDRTRRHSNVGARDEGRCSGFSDEAGRG